MADRVIFCSFKKPVPGREAASIASFRDAVAYCQRLQDAGQIESHDEVLLDFTAELQGFMLIKGQGEQLMRIVMDPEWQQIGLRANACTDAFSMVGGTTGEGVAAMMDAFVGTAIAAGH
jgi:hypothetical protein